MVASVALEHVLQLGRDDILRQWANLSTGAIVVKVNVFQHHLPVVITHMPHVGIATEDRGGIRTQGRSHRVQRHPDEWTRAWCYRHQCNQ